MTKAMLEAAYELALQRRADRDVAERTRMLEQVERGLVGWREDVGLSGGFVRRGKVRAATAVPFTPDELVALYTLRRSGRIVITGCLVAVTVVGGR